VESRLCKIGCAESDQCFALVRLVSWVRLAWMAIASHRMINFSIQVHSGPVRACGEVPKVPVIRKSSLWWKNVHKGFRNVFFHMRVTVELESLSALRIGAFFTTFGIAVETAVTSGTSPVFNKSVWPGTVFVGPGVRTSSRLQHRRAGNRPVPCRHHRSGADIFRRHSESRARQSDCGQQTGSRSSRVYRSFGLNLPRE